VARPREYIGAQQPRADGEELAARKAQGEALMLGLRTASGMRAPEGFDAELDELVRDGLIERKGDRVAPTRRGMDLHNQIALVVL
jgi:coproporphyrinogen III oxidase-like Fe-S oxidoreductase